MYEEVVCYIVFLIIFLSLAFAFPHSDFPGFSSSGSRLLVDDTSLFVFDDIVFSQAYYMDRSNSYWKFTLIVNSLLNKTTNFTAEYNTFVAPKFSDAGGTAVRWLAGSNNFFNKNLLNVTSGLPGLDGYPQHVNQEYPYGVRDNHFFGSGGMYTGGDEKLDPTNMHFNTWDEYQQYLTDNGMSQYGSDIDPHHFWD